MDRIFNIEFNELYHAAKTLNEKGCVFQYYEGENYDGRLLHINERELLHFSNCNYLGLERHPALIDGAIETLKKYGVQNSMSRAVASAPIYKEIEELLSQVFNGYPVVYPTTTLGHCSALPLLICEKDAIILDAYVHNSVRMASQFCKANGSYVLISKHNDMDHVKYLTYRLKKDGYRNVWYCADGLYSMHGDFCDLENLRKILDTEKDFYAYIDDAHSTGWTGKNGCGYAAEDGNFHPKTILAESLNKSISAGGGALVTKDKEVASYLKMAGQTMIFSGPMQPAAMGALAASLKLHLSPEIVSYQQELMELILYFRKRCAETNIPLVTKDNSPIQLLRIGDMEKLPVTLNHMFSKGFFPMTVTFPAIAQGDEGIRVTITRHLTRQDIDGFVETMAEALVLSPTVA